MPSEAFLKRRLVRKASPSRLKAKAPAVKRKGIWHVFLYKGGQDFAVVGVFRQDDLSDLGTGQQFESQLGADSLSGIFTTYSSPL